MFRNIKKYIHPSNANPSRGASLPPGAHSQVLFNKAKLGIPPKYQPIFEAVNLDVRNYMNGASFGPSHDYEHIQRVVALAHHIYTKELSHRSSWVKKVDPTVMYLCAMMHEVGDPDYLAIGHTQEDDIRDMLHHCNVPLPLAREVEYMIPRVSFSREQADPDIVKTECEDYPVLKIVQDAARIDTLGVPGRGRCFMFGGDWSEREAVQLLPTQFEQAVRYLKTETGRRYAEKWWKRMEKIDVSSVI